jgi:adenylate cyclase
MTLKDDIENMLDDVLGTKFDDRDGRKVPRTEEIGFHQAVKLKATYLYADMASSSMLAQSSPPATVGKIIRSFLGCAVRVIRHHGGHVRSFDGDRVMGIFHGPNKDDRAIAAAMQIHGAVHMLIGPAISNKFTSVQDSGWTLDHATGVAAGDAWLVRAGIRDNSDIVSIGAAPNIAAKFSDLRQDNYKTTTRHLSARLSSTIRVPRRSIPPRDA